MTFSLDSTTVEITCPKCSKKLKEKIGRLKRDKHITCPSCGRIAVNTDQLRSVEDGIKKQLAQLSEKKTTIKI